MAFSAFHASAFPPVGRWLKARRDVLGLSLSQASDKAQMSEQTLQLLESELFLDLPEPAFAKGYLRRYAKHLSLNPDEVSAMFDGWMQLHDAQHLVTAVVPSNRAPTDATRLALRASFGKLPQMLGHALHSQAGHAAVVALCLGVFSFFLSQGSELSREQLVQHEVSAEQRVTAGPTPVAPTSAPAFASPVRAVAAASPATAVSAQASASVRQHGRILSAGHWLVATETTHVHVTDRRGLIVFSGLVKSGHPIALKGMAPFTIDSAKDGTISLQQGGDPDRRPLSIAAL